MVVLELGLVELEYLDILVVVLYFEFSVEEIVIFLVHVDGVVEVDDLDGMFGRLVMLMVELIVLDHLCCLTII